MSILVSDVMTRTPVTAKPDANLLDCARKMVKKKVGSLLLVKDKRLVGFISEEDILWALVKKSRKDLASIKAIDISPRKIAKIDPYRSVKDAIVKMKKLGFERLPVIHEGKLVGMITSKDIFNFHPEFYPELEEMTAIREESRKLKRVKEAGKKSVRDGICEECGNRDILSSFNGMLICESCRNSM